MSYKLVENTDNYMLKMFNYLCTNELKKVKKVLLCLGVINQEY